MPRHEPYQLSEPFPSLVARLVPNVCMRPPIFPSQPSPLALSGLDKDGKCTSQSAPLFSLFRGLLVGSLTGASPVASTVAVGRQKAVETSSSQNSAAHFFPTTHGPDSHRTSHTPPISRLLPAHSPQAKPHSPGKPRTEPTSSLSTFGSGRLLFSPPQQPASKPSHRGPTPTPARHHAQACRRRGSQPKLGPCLASARLCR